MHSLTHRHNIHIGNGLHFLCIAHTNLWDPQCTAQVCPAGVAWPTGMTEVRRTHACCSSIHVHTVDPLKDDVIMTSLIISVYMYSSIVKECPPPTFGSTSCIGSTNDHPPASMVLGTREHVFCWLKRTETMQNTTYTCSFDSHFAYD